MLKTRCFKIPRINFLAGTAKACERLVDVCEVKRNGEHLLGDGPRVPSFENHYNLDGLRYISITSLLDTQALHRSSAVFWALRTTTARAHQAPLPNRFPPLLTDTGPGGKTKIKAPLSTLQYEDQHGTPSKPGL